MMEYRNLGASGLRVPVLSFGALDGAELRAVPGRAPGVVEVANALERHERRVHDGGAW